MTYGGKPFDSTLSPYYAIGQVEGTIRGLRSNDEKVAAIAEILDEINRAHADYTAELEKNISEVN